jgi:hypothetical protein
MVRQRSLGGEVPLLMPYPATMLFRQPLWARLADGSVTVAFRRWRRPTVRAGGTLRTAAGVLAIDRVDIIEPADITAEDAARAGYESVAAVVADLPAGDDRRLYRIEFHHAGDDPRVALRERDDITAADIAAIRGRLDRLDAASADGPWTRQTLRLIADHPAERAADLAERVSQDRPRFKRRVRRLKELGLTESLVVGYRLSPRGRAVLVRV